MPDVRVHAHAALHPRWTGGAGQHEVHELRPSVSRFGEVLARHSGRRGEDGPASVICFYLGVNVMTQLDKDNTRINELVELANRLAPLAAPMLR